MGNQGRISENYGFLPHALTISSASTSFTIPINVEGADSVMFLLGMGTAAGGVNTTVHIRQGGTPEVAASTNSTTVPGATAIVLGSTAANLVSNALRGLITVTTAATAAQTVTVNTISFTHSSLGGETTNSTLFGSTLGATVAGGLEAIMNSLSSKINASTVGALQGLTAATVSTANVSVRLNDTASTDVNLLTSAASPFSAAYEAQQTIVEIPVDMLNSTSKYLSAMFCSAATSVLVGSVAIKGGVTHNPPPPHGVITQVKAI